MTDFIEILKQLTLPELLDMHAGAAYQFAKSPKNRTYEQMKAIRAEILHRCEWRDEA